MQNLELPLVHILMATCQGESYLQEQLDSIRHQTYSNWVLHVSDDASSDRTLEIVQAFKDLVEGVDHFVDKEQHRSNPGPAKVYVAQGPQKGPTQNFLKMVSQIGACEEQHTQQTMKKNGVSLSPNDLVAFCDQDDVWLPEKLERAVAWHLNELKANNECADRPMLYATRSYLVNEMLEPMGLSKSLQGLLGFNAALVENVLSGNTMVMNVALIRILKCIELPNSVWHDWSAYLVATGCGGCVHWDKEPLVFYRQHQQNVIGVKTGLVEQLLRAFMVLKGRYKVWTHINLRAMKDIEPKLSTEALKLVNLYKEIRSEQSIWRRLSLIRHLSIRRQSRFMQVLFYVGLVMGLI
jgi:glycosyltransferase involved in cell wall biosynthesis